MKCQSITTVQLTHEEDVVRARQRARRIAELLGFPTQDQIRVATTVSELARNAFQYAHGGAVEFALGDDPAALRIKVSDKGPGIAALDSILDGTYVSSTGMGVGILGSRKLMDSFAIDSQLGAGTVISIEKYLPRRSLNTKPMTVVKIAEELMKAAPESPYESMHRQNHELILTLDELRLQKRELNEVNTELNETNRGVVALYAELDEKAESLKTANAIKTSFLANMTHEFRTPLSSIISIARLMHDQVDGELNEEQLKQVEYIRRSADGLLVLVNDLLDIAKVEAGKVTITADDFICNDVLVGMRGVFRPLIPAGTEIELVFEDLMGNQPLHTDKGKLSQIFRNLISNALKYTERGTIRILAREDGPDNVIFEVHDSGIGIAASDFEIIFHDFAQIDSALQRRSKGTGLGLPLSRKLARLLGGDLWVESREGHGATFFVRIPRRYAGLSEGSIIEQHLPPEARS